ncbi:pathogenesis-related protein 5-like [Amaranthus tricolor]|uniref:pathogenesis-related protein 5-like n=1 Tax=Amaranthus tricolor TaxID=29722 RepID=UPI002586C7F6|nr:pathogenesis-related protein 5-like [Amaranthus tricolor]
MTTIHCRFFLVVSSLLLGFSTKTASATVFNLHNNCPYTVWPGSLTANGEPLLLQSNSILPPGDSITLNPPAGWSGRFWARTGCNFNTNGQGNCSTGDCGGLSCTGGGLPPVSLVEFTLNGAGRMDFYDVSLVDGYNVGIGVKPINGGTGNCEYAGCVEDLNGSCPPELQVIDPAQEGVVVACKSACAAFNRPEYCCSEDHATPETCSPTEYSELFKNACPSAYSYAYDDASSTCTCVGSDYLITFCPSAV